VPFYPCWGYGIFGIVVFRFDQYLASETLHEEINVYCTLLEKVESVSRGRTQARHAAQDTDRRVRVREDKTGKYGERTIHGNAELFNA
jgi:hypothetical protein